MQLARRDRVLAHPDLAKRLTEPPLGFPDPTDWSGWIPPQTVPEGMCGQNCGRYHRCDGIHAGRRNDSLRRAALVDIAAEAWRRDNQPTLDEAEQLPADEPDESEGDPDA